MKEKLSLFLLVTLLFACSKDNDIEFDNQNSQNDYVVLIPESSPIAITEKDDGRIIMATQYLGGTSSSYKINQLNNRGEIDWEYDLQINDAIFGGALFIINSNIYFYYKTGDEIKLITLDDSGSVINNDFLANQNYNCSLINVFGNKFIGANYEPNSINYDEYSSSGDILNSNMLNFSGASRSSSNLIKKDNKLLLFRSYNYVYPRYEDFECNIFDSNGNLENTIVMELEDNGSRRSGFPIEDDRVLITETEDSMGGTNGDIINLNIFSYSGDKIFTTSFNGFTSSKSLSPLSNNRICFLGQRNHTREGKKLNFKILNSNLELVFEKYIGSLGNTGTFNFRCYEGLNSYYIYGITDSDDGDFDLPNNSTTTDLFLYKINK